MSVIGVSQSFSKISVSCSRPTETSYPILSSAALLTPKSADRPRKMISQVEEGCVIEKNKRYNCSEKRFLRGNECTIIKLQHTHRSWIRTLLHLFDHYFISKCIRSIGLISTQTIHETSDRSTTYINQFLRGVSNLTLNVIGVVQITFINILKRLSSSICEDGIS